MAETERFEELPLARVHPDPHQPRLHMDEAGLSELVASIERDGLLQPIVVRPEKDGYTVIDGHRRRQACESLGWESIPAVIRSVEEREAFRLSLVANLQREDLSPFELSQGYLRLQKDFGLQQKDIAQLVRKSEGTISEAIRIGTLPEEIRKEYEALPPEDRPARSFLLLLVRVRLKSAQLAMWRKILKGQIATLEEARQEVRALKEAKKGGQPRRAAHHLVLGAALRAARIPEEHLRANKGHWRRLVEASQILSRRVEELRPVLGEPEEAVAETPPPEPTERPRRGGRRRGATTQAQSQTAGPEEPHPEQGQDAAARDAGLVKTEAPEDETGVATEDSLAAVESADTA